MAIELYANGAATTLNGSINNSVTSLVVASAAGFPSSGNFRILVGTEILIVTAVSGTTFTVTRGAEGTAAASHTSGDALTHILTRDGLKQLRADAFTMTADASKPAQSSEGAGRLWLPTDDVVASYDDGSAWTSLGPIRKMKAPDDSAFSWFNQGGATTTQKNGSVVLNVGVSASANFRGRVKAYTAPCDVKMGFVNLAVYKCIMGMVARESGSGKIHTFTAGYSSTDWFVQSIKWSDPSTFSAIYNLQHGSASLIMPIGQYVQWMRYVDDSTNRKFYWSADGFEWILLHSVSRTDFLTPDQVGFCVDTEDTSYPGIMRVIHWEE